MLSESHDRQRTRLPLVVQSDSQRSPRPRSDLRSLVFETQLARHLLARFLLVRNREVTARIRETLHHVLMSEGFVDLYPLNVNRETERNAAIDADSCRYRRILRRMAVTGLPERVDVGDVVVSFIEGPVRTQRTVLRQRPGVPFTFDKHMERAVEVGDGELVTVVELPVSLDRGIAIDSWRARADAALGLLISRLDERIAGEQLGEDVILMRAGEPVAAAEQVALVRSHMPFEVTADDRAAIAKLADVDLGEANSGARAAALYAVATAQGPSRVGFLMMWLAVDAIVYEGRNQVRELRQALAAAGFVEAWLNMQVGQLAGLRGNVAHGKAEADELVYDGFYDMEAIARVLIARAAGIDPAWPSSPTAVAFRPHVAAVLGPQARDYEEVWHAQGLPRAHAAAADPTLPERYDAVMDGHAAWIPVEGADPSVQLGQLRWAVWQALVALRLDVEDVRITVTDQHEYGAQSDFAVSANRLLLSPAHPHAFAVEPNGGLVLELCALLSQQQVLGLGVPPGDAFGAFLIELVGAWAVVSTTRGEYVPELAAEIDPQGVSLPILGQYVGYAVAGDRLATGALNRYLQFSGADPEIVALVGEIRSALDRVTSLDDMLVFVKSLIAAAEQ